MAKITLTQEPETIGFGTKELKCRLDIPRQWYQDKLDAYESISPKDRTTYNLISLYKARLRYYDAHIEEANNKVAFKKDLAILRVWKKVFKEQGKLSLWHDCCHIERVVKAKNIEAWPMVKHALEVINKHFGD